MIYQAYMALNNVDAAAESFRKALELEPNDGSISLLILMLYKMLHRL